jgi:hypothetical protein
MSPGCHLREVLDATRSTSRRACLASRQKLRPSYRPSPEGTLQIDAPRIIRSDRVDLGVPALTRATSPGDVLARDLTRLPAVIVYQDEVVSARMNGFAATAHSP